MVCIRPAEAHMQLELFIIYLYIKRGDDCVMYTLRENNNGYFKINAQSVKYNLGRIPYRYVKLRNGNIAYCVIYEQE